ncbi:MAG: ABC transporter ATP-binding protein [Oscillospiraceae bacterium]
MLKAIGRIFKWCGKEKKRLYLGFVYSFLRSIFISVPIMLAAYGVQLILLDRDGVQPLTGTQILILLGAMVIAVLLRFVFGYLRASTQDSIGFELTANQRVRIGDILKSVSLGFFSKNSTGEIASAVSTDLSFIEMHGMHMVDVVVNGYIYVFVTVLFLLFFSLPTGLIALAGLLLDMLALNLLSKASMRNAPAHQKAQDDMVGATVEYLRGLPVAKAFRQEGASVQGIRKAYRDSRDINIKIEWDFVWTNALHKIALLLTSLGIVVYSAFSALGGGMSLPIMAMMVMFAFVMFGNIEGLGDAHHVLRVIAATFDKLEPIENAHAIDEGVNAKKPKQFDIAFDNVTFAYDEEAVVKNITLQIPQGTTTAIVGPSGSGKTTLCNLLARFYDIDSGTIQIGGVDVREQTSEGLLSNISMVFQKVYLFHDTILNNIRFGRPDATPQEVEAIAKRAQCHSFIMALPDGYNTVIGEGGATLSGGEKQRISIARAMLKDAPIVILDEATASVDPENEHLIQEALSGLTQNKTVVVIAHRLATIQNANQIVVMDEGRIVQNGRHEELLQQNGLYKTFVDIREKAEGWSIA